MSGSDDRYARAKAVFFDACDVEPDRRAAFLDGACGGDAELRAEVDSLLAHHDENEADGWEPPTESTLDGPEAGDELLGARLAERYEVIGELGRGGMGRVFLATDRRFHKPVALKALFFSSDVLRRAFEREALLLNDLRHKALPVVIDYFAERSWHFLVMDFVPGEDLADALAARVDAGAGPFAVADVARWTDQVLDALTYLHEHEPPIVHRDIKPQNLKLTPRGDVVLLDFGLAKGAAVAGTNAPASVAGFTPNYAPIEQIQGTGTDPRSDLYALGATLYHLLTASLPLDACTRAEAILGGGRDPLVPAHERNPAVPRSVSAVLQRAMALTRSSRPASAVAMREELAAASRIPGGEAPPGEPSRVAPNNLPQHATSFVGRRREIAAVTYAIATARLVTLVGSGGVGKTRLALRVAEESLGEYPDGVWLVELAGLADAALVASAVAMALGLRETETVSAGDAVVTALADKNALLVLDNCEHVLEAAARLSHEVVAACPGVRMLATSRQALGVPGETAWPVLPLSLPNPDDPVGQEESDAVSLFADRARAAKPTFAVGADAALVARLCGRLDGIPLAIELAAARVKILSLEQIDARLENRFNLLTGGDRESPERHQTLRATVDWSYELLAPGERAVLQRMSLFPGGCTLDAVEAVSTGEDVLDAVARLVDRSLVAVDEREGMARYRLLETVRAYAIERLGETGGEPSARRRVLDWAGALATAAAAELGGPGQRSWVSRLESEHDNLRAALDWGLTDDGSSEVALALANALVTFWHIGGYLREGSASLERALVRCPDAPAEARSDALKGVGTLANALGDYRRARGHYEAGLALARETGDPLRVGRLLNNLALTAYRCGEYPEATALFEECLAIFRATGNARLVSLALNNLGTLHSDCGDPERAAPFYEESLAIKREIGDGIGTATLLYNLGVVAQRRGETERARDLFEEGRALWQEIGDRQGLAVALVRLARADVVRGDPERGAALLAEAITLQRDLGNRPSVCETLEGFVHLASDRGDWERALRLSGAASRLRDALGHVLPPSDAAEFAANVAPARSALGPDAERFVAEGRAMALDRAVEYAIGGSSATGRGAR